MSAWSPDDSMEIPGFMEPPELEWLHDRAAESSSVVEVGCWMGRSTSALAAGCPGPVFTIDHFRGSPSELDAAHAEALTIDVEAEARRHLARYPNVRIIAADSLAAARAFARDVDMVFVDGEHTLEAVLRDLILWAPRAKRLLCGHDRDWDGVLRALAVYGVPFEAGPGSLWYMETIA